MADTRGKKFTIKSFRTHSPMDPTAARSVWSQLAGAVDEIHNRNASLLSFEELYRNAYNLVLHRHGSLLYDGVCDKITQHLTFVAEKVHSAEEGFLLQALQIEWEHHRTTMMMVRDILMYMDRTYVVQSKRRPVYNLGLHLFQTVVWEYKDVKDRCVRSVLDMIAAERNATSVENLHQHDGLLKSVLGMLLELGYSTGMSGGNDPNVPPKSSVYERDFEAIFLATTQEYFRVESLECVSSSSVPAYVQKAEQRLKEEQFRSSRYLAGTSCAPLLCIVETEFIDRHAKTLVENPVSGVATMLRDDRLTDLKKMYELFQRVPPTVEFIRTTLSSCVKQSGEGLINDYERGAADAGTFVRGVLTLRDKYSTIVETSFSSEKKAQKKLKESLERFLNVDSRAAHCLAIYVDESLRSGLRGATEAEINDQLTKVITVFRYLQDKDVFEAFYKQYLAKRLLSNKSVSEDAEKNMVALLKAECGYQFTSKLEGMFNDMRISKDTREAFKAYKQTSLTRTRVDIEVDVLTTGYWPSQTVAPCILPAAVLEAQSDFLKYYLKTHTGRKLQWQTSTGSADIRGNFKPDKGSLRRHELCVSTYQMCILVLFNDQDTLSLKDIREVANIPEEELQRHLISLCTPKHRILKKASRGKAISGDSDTFTYNNNYSSKLKRVKIPLVSMKDCISGKNQGGEANGGAKNAIPAPVEEDRRHLVEASIVRIMKSRKSLHHNDLIAEVSRQLSVRFVPSPPFIKQRIESLIEREYLERDDHDRRVYKYMA